MSSKSFRFIEYDKGGRGRPRGVINNTDLWLLPPTASMRGKGVLLRIPILVLIGLGSPPRIRVLYDPTNKAISIRGEQDELIGYKVAYRHPRGGRATLFTIQMTRLGTDEMPLGSYQAVQPDVFVFDKPLEVEE